MIPKYYKETHFKELFNKDGKIISVETEDKTKSHKEIFSEWEKKAKKKYPVDFSESQSDILKTKKKIYTSESRDRKSQKKL